jgi:hypothetical protein
VTAGGARIPKVRQIMIGRVEAFRLIVQNTGMDIILESANTSSQELHLIPCQIDHNGPAKVSSYFVQSPTADPATGKSCATATFRGRQLYGIKNQLPATYTGNVSLKAIIVRILRKFAISDKA